MTTVVDLAHVSQALGTPVDGSASAQITELAAFFDGLLTSSEASMLMLCARIGVLDTSNQIAVREAIESRDDVKEKMMAANNVTQECGLNGGFIGGEKPSVDDAVLFASLYNLFALLLKPEGRAPYNHLKVWFEKCSELLAEIVMGGNHMAGVQRIGNQIDCFAKSSYVRSNADFANALNANVKKKISQRKLEKAAKAGGAQNSKNLPAASSSFQFSGGAVSKDATPDEKIAAVRAALSEIGVNAEGECVMHEPAKTMADMPPELRSKGGFVCKNLFLKAKKPRKDVENDSCIWLVSVPEKAVVDMKAVSKSLGYKDELRQTKPEVLEEILGVQPGNVTPFALLNDAKGLVNVILDETMMASPDNKLWFHPLTNSATMQITASDLLQFIAATARTPILYPFGVKSTTSDKQPTEPTSEQPAVPRLELDDVAAKQRLWDRLKEDGIIPYKEENPDLTVKRPTGHSTHNLFVKDKKSKQLYMVSMRQEIDVNLKVVASAIGAKELRLTDASKEAFCHEKGCMSLLSLYNNVQGTVTPLLDSELMKAKSLRICAGCDDPLDHSQHNVVDITPQQLSKLLEESNTPQAKEIDLK